MVRNFGLAALMAVGVASSAYAGPFSTAGTGGAWNTSVTDFYTLPTEDGTAENSVGFGVAGTVAYANKFTIAAGGETITHINTIWGFSSTAAINHTFAIWTTTGPLSNMTLASTPVTVPGGTAGTAVSIDIPDATFSVGDVVYIGFLADGGSPSSFFGSIDQTAPVGTSSIIWGTPSTGAFTAANIGTAGLIGEIGTFGLPGDWTIRANAIPAPGALALLGLGGLMAGRRRR